MRLTELDPIWIKERGRAGLGVMFECPSCRGTRICVLFLNPLDGGKPVPPGSDLPGENGGKRWARSGMDFETLTVSPSIDASVVKRDYYQTEADYQRGRLPCTQGGNAHWHGFVTHGEVR